MATLAALVGSKSFVCLSGSGRGGRRSRSGGLLLALVASGTWRTRLVGAIAGLALQEQIGRQGLDLPGGDERDHHLEAARGTQEALGVAVDQDPVQRMLARAQQVRQVLHQQGQRHVKGVTVSLMSDMQTQGLQHLSQDESDTELLEDQRELAAPPTVQAQEVFEGQEGQFNGLITNDKFCMSRTARLQLSHWRLPRSARQTSRAGVKSPVTGNTEEYLPQQETHEETTMDRSAPLRRTA